MRTFPSVLGVALLAVLTSCTADNPPARTTADGTPVPIHLIGVESERLERVDVAVDDSTATSSPMARAAAAVEAMMDVVDDEERSNLWGEFCALGDGVGTIESDDRRVTVTLTGEGGALCDLSEHGYELRRQQLAWTVVDNLEADPAMQVRVITSAGTMPWPDTVVDRAYLAESSG